MAPDENALAEDLTSDRYLLGVARGYWELVNREATTVTFKLRAKTGRRVGVRLDCSGYPGVAPTGQLWAIAENHPLPVEQWPTGGRASQVFNPGWSASFGGAFYFPYDRRAIEGHDAWASDHTGHVWGVDKTVVDVLVLLREILRSATGPDDLSAAADQVAS